MIVAFGIYNCTVQTRIKYWLGEQSITGQQKLDQRFLHCLFYVTAGSKTTDYYNWLQWDYDNHLKAYETITPYIRSLGIKRSDKVISIPDESINITLYLMDQKGFDDFGFNDLKDGNRIKKFEELGAKYLFLNDSTYTSKNWLKPYLKNKIGSYQNISIYAL